MSRIIILLTVLALSGCAMRNNSGSVSASYGGVSVAAQWRIDQ